jgi:fatty-acyl-CoA synthase
VTGRIKDLIILNGRNIHPQSVEWAVASVEGVRKGNVVAFSRPGAHSEELIVTLETRAEITPKFLSSIRTAVQKEVSATVADIVCLPVGSLPKTSSGKLQRRKTRTQYLRGTIGKEGMRTPGSTDRVKLARHMAKGMWSRAKSAMLSR